MKEIPQIRLYNSYTRKKDLLTTHEPGKLGMYTCGPTVYHYAHIGNLRSYIMEDVLEKFFRYAGYDVKRVMNVTDVGHLTSDADEGEDKMIKGAKREHKTVMEIAKFYTDAFFSDCAKLNIRTPDVVEPATNLIPEYINMVQVLLDKGYAYKAGGNVYFDTSKLDKYYVFGEHEEEDLAVGVREGVEEDTNKKNKVSIVVQHSFKKEDGTVVCKLLTGGDAEHDVWEKILENNQVGSNLDWNIFEAPHHCSWTFFNDSGKDEVCQAAKDILNHQIGYMADVVSSCQSIEPDDKQAPPPSYKAMKEYKMRLKGGSEHFRNTSDEFKSSKEPLVYEINDYGKVKKIYVKSTVQTVVQKPAPRAGMK